MGPASDLHNTSVSLLEGRVEAQLEAARRNAELASVQLQSAKDDAERALEAHRAAEGGRGAVRFDSDDAIVEIGSQEERRRSKKGRKASADGGDGSPGGEVPRTKRFMDYAPFGTVWGDYTGELDARGQRHGRGDIVYKDNSEYRGKWRDDK